MVDQPEREAMLRKAIQALGTGDRRGARSLVRYLVRQDPNDQVARAMLARLQPAQGPAGTHRDRPPVQPPRWGFRFYSLLGATALLLVLIVALMWPEGASRAWNSGLGGGPAGGVPATTARLVAGGLLGGAVTTTTVALPASPPIPFQGGTCITGSVIDRYHQAAGEGWAVTATSEAGVTQTVAVGPGGVFQFDNLSGGTHTVELALGSGWREFTPVSFTVTLSGEGNTCAQVRYKVEALACLEVTKLDSGGLLTLPQVGIPGWVITATNGVDLLVGITDGSGRYRFDNLALGTWTVTEEKQVGWEPDPNFLLGYEQQIVLTSPVQVNACDALQFVNRQVRGGCIVVRKVDTSGTPLAGWQIALTRDDGTDPGSVALTDAAGEVRFDDLQLGQWTLTESQLAWWRPVGGASQQLSLDNPGPDCTEVLFTNEPLGCIEGYKINHLDQGLAGWTITATNDFTGEQLAVVTDQTGYFQFPDITLGTWRLAEQPQIGWEAVTPAEFEVQVNAPFTCVPVRFKNKTNFACVDVFKRDAYDQSGLANWEIWVQPAYGGAPMIGFTDGTGWVRFNGLTPGEYTVTEQSQVGWTAVTSVTLP